MFALSYFLAYGLPQESPQHWLASLRAPLTDAGLLDGSTAVYDRYRLFYCAAWVLALAGLVGRLQSEWGTFTPRLRRAWTVVGTGLGVVGVGIEQVAVCRVHLDHDVDVAVRAGFAPGERAEQSRVGCAVLGQERVQFASVLGKELERGCDSQPDPPVWERLEAQLHRHPGARNLTTCRLTTFGRLRQVASPRPPRLHAEDYLADIPEEGEARVPLR